MKTTLVPLWVITTPNRLIVRAIVAAHHKSAALKAADMPGEKYRVERVGSRRVDGTDAAESREFAEVVLRCRPSKAPGGKYVRGAPGTSPRDIAAKKALAAAANVYGIHHDYARYRRTRESARAKSATWYAMVRLSGWSRAGAGRAIGHHHGTVISALKQADALVAKPDTKFMAAVMSAMTTLNACAQAAAIGDNDVLPCGS